VPKELTVGAVRLENAALRFAGQDPVRAAAAGDQRVDLRDRHKATNSIIPQSSALPNAVAEYVTLLRDIKRTTAPFLWRAPVCRIRCAVRGTTLAAQYDAKIAKQTLRGCAEKRDDFKRHGQTGGNTPHVDAV